MLRRYLVQDLRSLGFFTEALYFGASFEQLHVIMKPLLVVFGIISPPELCPLLSSKNVPWGGSEHPLPFAGAMLLFFCHIQDSCNIEQQCAPPLLPTVILSVLKNTWYCLLL